MIYSGHPQLFTFEDMGVLTFFFSEDMGVLTFSEDMGVLTFLTFCYSRRGCLSFLISFLSFRLSFHFISFLVLCLRFTCNRYLFERQRSLFGCSFESILTAFVHRNPGNQHGNPEN